MSIKEELWQEIQSSEDELILAKTLDFLKFIKTQQVETAKIQNIPASTGKSLLKHLNTLDTWRGEDLEDCFKAIKEDRAPTKFKDANPFD